MDHGPVTTNSIVAVIQRQAPSIYRRARRKNCSHHDSEDILQEVAKSAVQFAAREKGTLPCDKLINQFAKCRIVDCFRYREKSPLSKAGDLEIAFSQIKHTDAQTSDENDRMVERLLKLLNSRPREIIERHYFLEETVAEIAAVMQLSENAVRLSLGRSLKKLAKRGNAAY